MPLAFEIDPVSENAANVPLLLTDRPNGWTVATFEAPTPGIERQWASSPDTDGELPGGYKFTNRVLTLTTRVNRTTNALVGTELGKLGQKVGKLIREGGTLKVTYPDGLVVIYDVLQGEQGLTFDWVYENRHIAVMTLVLTCKPLGRGTPIVYGYHQDIFSSDTFAAGDWTVVDAGFSVSGGVLTGLLGTNIAYYSAARSRYANVQVTEKINVVALGATVENVGILIKYLDASNYIYVKAALGTGTHSLQMRKVDAGVDTGLGGVVNLTTPAVISTSYWLRGRMSGNTVTVDWFTAAPPTGVGTPVNTNSFTLTGADITKFGAGILGYQGLVDISIDNNGNYTHDNFTIEAVEQTGPTLELLLDGLPGDTEGTGVWQIDNLGTSDLWWLTWGLQSRYFDSSVNAALMYEAESRTALGGATTVAGPTGASGTGSNVVRETSLSTTYRALVSSQATGAGAHLSHIGTYRAYARVQTPVTNTGTVTVALEWAVGDFARWTRNADEVLDATWEGSWRLVDLGLVTIPKTAQGIQRWEGRLLGLSSVAGDDVDVDMFPILIPVDEGSAAVATSSRLPTATAFSALDSFATLGGGTALNTRTPEIGAAWVTTGAATDFAGDVSADTQTVSPRVARSTSVVETSARAGAVGSALTTQRVQADVYAKGSSAAANLGVIARYVDDNNYLWLRLHALNVPPVELVKKVAGVTTVLASATPILWPTDTSASIHFDLVVTTDGRATGSMTGQGARAQIQASDPVLATAGALASGKGGIADQSLSTSGLFRGYDNVSVSVPSPDAVIFLGQSLEVRSDRMLREDAAGVVWTQLAPEGDYLQVPPAGREARSLRAVVLSSVFDPAVGPHAYGPLATRLTYTPRYLVAPQT